MLIFPGDAWTMIEIGLLPNVELVSLTGAEYREVVEDCSRKGLAGGWIYDMIHIKAAHKAGCNRLYTLNVKHFREIAPDELRDAITAP